MKKRIFKIAFLCSLVTLGCSENQEIMQPAELQSDALAESRSASSKGLELCWDDEQQTIDGFGVVYIPKKRRSCSTAIWPQWS